MILENEINVKNQKTSEGEKEMKQLQKKRRARKRFEKLVEQEIARRQKEANLSLD